MTACMPLAWIDSTKSFESQPLSSQYRLCLQASNQRFPFAWYRILHRPSVTSGRGCQAHLPRHVSCWWGRRANVLSLCSPFFAAPAVCWCARTAVLSIIKASMSEPVLTASRILCHKLPSPQRLKRVQVVCELPNFDGKSRHGEQVRTIHKTASINWRLSCVTRPGSPAFLGSSKSTLLRNSLHKKIRSYSGLFLSQMTLQLQHWCW